MPTNVDRNYISSWNFSSIAENLNESACSRRFAFLKYISLYIIKRFRRRRRRVKNRGGGGPEAGLF